MHLEQQAALRGTRVPEQRYLWWRDLLLQSASIVLVIYRTGCPEETEKGSPPSPARCHRAKTSKEAKYKRLRG